MEESGAVTCQKSTVAIEFTFQRKAARRRKGALEAIAAINRYSPEIRRIV
jgi:hypothetical protein